MQARLAAAAVLLVLAIPASGKAGDNPWTSIKQLFREPVNELKQQFKQLRAPPRATTAPKPEATVGDTDPATGEAVPVPIPVARPAPEVPAGPLPALAATPAQDNATTQVDPADPMSRFVWADDTDVRPIDDDADGDAAVAAAPGAETMSLPTTAEMTEAFENALAPIPRPRPENAFAYAAVGPAPASQSAAAIGTVLGPLPSIAKPPAAARSTCGVALARLGVEAKPIAPIHEGTCGVPEPVTVAALGGGATDLTTKAIIGCRTAEVLANWLRDAAQPAARELLGGDIVGLRVAASYTCRTRNGVAGAKLSEHGRGNAIDISAFNVAGRGWIEVGGLHGPAPTRFLRTIRKSACGPFKTVLGPGSDAYHSDHFHFDLAQRNNRGPSKGLYCR